MRHKKDIVSIDLTTNVDACSGLGRVHFLLEKIGKNAREVLEGMNIDILCQVGIGNCNVAPLMEKQCIIMLTSSQFTSVLQQGKYDKYTGNHLSTTREGEILSNQILSLKYPKEGEQRLLLPVLVVDSDMNGILDQSEEKDEALLLRGKLLELYNFASHDNTMHGNGLVFKRGDGNINFHLDEAFEDIDLEHLSIMFHRDLFHELYEGSQKFKDEFHQTINGVCLILNNIKNQELKQYWSTVAKRALLVLFEKQSSMIQMLGETYSRIDFGVESSNFYEKIHSNSIIMKNGRTISVRDLRKATIESFNIEVMSDELFSLLYGE